MRRWMLPEQLFVNHGGGMVAVSSQYSTVAVVVLLTLTITVTYCRTASSHSHTVLRFVNKKSWQIILNGN